MLCKKINSQNEEFFRAYTIHGYALEYLKKFYPEKVSNFDPESDFDKLMIDFVEMFKENKIKNLDLYDTVLLDEGQDFAKEWFEAVQELVHPDGTLCVFYDEFQTLYEEFGRGDISFLDMGSGIILKGI